MGCANIKKSNIVNPSKVHSHSTIHSNSETNKKSQPQEISKISDASTANKSLNPLPLQTSMSVEEKIKTVPWISQNFDISTIEKLGAGGFGQVFGAHSFKESRKLAIKFMHFEGKEELDSMMKEITIMSALQRYGNIVKIVDVNVEFGCNEIYIAMEQADGTLDDLVVKYSNKIPNELFLQIFSDLAFGLLHAHEEGFVHSDIKPKNILYFKVQDRSKLKNIQRFNVHDQSLVMKLTDWGAGATKCTGKTTRFKTGMAFTPAYVAPEIVMDGEKVILEKCDVFSLGMTMVNCCGVPLRNMKHISNIEIDDLFSEQVDKIAKMIGPEYGEDIRALLKKMLSFDKHQRPVMQEIVSYLQNLSKKSEKTISGSLNNIQNEVDVEQKNTEYQLKNNTQIEAVVEQKITQSHNKTTPEHAPEETIAKLIEDIPKLSDMASEILAKLGPCKFKSPEDNSLPSYGPYEYNDGRVHIGQWKNGLPHGRGKIYFPNGSLFEGEFVAGQFQNGGRLIDSEGNVYEGEYKNNLSHGKGLKLYSDGSQYEGEWFEDKKHGVGFETLWDGSKYEGKYEHGKKNGKGMMKYSNGDVYEGEFYINMLHGLGVYQYHNNAKYSGEWKNNKKNGKGVFSFPNGNKYDGEWRDDKMKGKGVYIWANGDKYEGEYSDSKRNGKGIFIFSSDGKKYEGEWHNDIKNGYGEFSWPTGNRYKGEYQDDKIQGKGVFTWLNGDKYEGNFSEGKKNGKGTFFYADGRKYEGQWLNDKMHGIGDFSWPDGSIYKGSWKEDKQNGNGFYITIDGKEKFGEWYEGTYIDPEFIKKMTCPKGHDLKWSSKCNYLSQECVNCKSTTKRSSRWFCEVCQEKYCVGCKPPYFFFSKCPLSHVLEEKQLNFNTCDNCRETICGKAYRDQNCDFDICLICMDQMKKMQTIVKVNGSPPESVNKILPKCSKGHDMKWSSKCSYLSDECVNCKTKTKTISRWLCEVCQERYCVGCRKPDVILSKCPLNHAVLEKDLFTNTCDTCRQPIRGKGYRDPECDFDTCLKCMEQLKKDHKEL